MDEQLTLTDTVLSVVDLQEALPLWGSLGLEISGGGPGWAELRDRRSGQKLTLVEGFEIPWGFGVRAREIGAALAHLEAQGIEVVRRGHAAEGFDFALCRTASGVTLVIYTV